MTLYFNIMKGDDLFVDHGKPRPQSLIERKNDSQVRNYEDFVEYSEVFIITNDEMECFSE